MAALVVCVVDCILSSAGDVKTKSMASLEASKRIANDTTL